MSVSARRQPRQRGGSRRTGSPGGQPSALRRASPASGIIRSTPVSGSARTAKSWGSSGEPSSGPPRRTSVLSFIKCRIEAFQLDAGVVRGELPVVGWTGSGPSAIDIRRRYAALRVALPVPIGRTGRRSGMPGLLPVKELSGTRFHPPLGGRCRPEAGAPAVARASRASAMNRSLRYRAAVPV